MAGGAWPAARGLLERGGELARIEEAVAALGRGQGGVLVIQGAAGIGKSALLQVLCERAAEQRLQTLTARASELERDFGFGVVRQLLETRLVRATESERADLLAGAAGLAGPVLGLGGGVRDSFAALHGLYWLVANLAVGAPVVLAVDDLQWADEPSLRWLVYLCHRLEGVPVLVAATTLWVPNWSSSSCDLGVFVDQSPEPIAASDARLGRRRRGWNRLEWRCLVQCSVRSMGVEVRHVLG